MKTLPLLLALVLACRATAPPPSPQEERLPGYLGLAFTYHKPDPQKGKHGWLMVRHVIENGPAYRAGLQPQTVITAINGTPLDYPDDTGVLEFFRTIRPGEKVRLTLASPEAKDLVVVASEMPSDMVAVWKKNFEPAAPKRP